MRYSSIDSGKQKCREYFREQRAKKNNSRQQPRRSNNHPQQRSQPRSRPRMKPLVGPSRNRQNIHRPLVNPSPPRTNSRFYNPKPMRPLVPIREQQSEQVTHNFPQQQQAPPQSQQPIIIQQPPVVMQQPAQQQYYPKQAHFTFWNITGTIIICAIAFSVFMAVATRDPAGVIDMWKSAFQFVVSGMKDIFASL